MKIEAKLSKPLEVLSADEEIISLTGWDLGFITAGRPLHVLHVEPIAEVAAHGICSDDLLVSIDGQSVSAIAKDDVAKLLKVAARLEFERTEPPPELQDVAMEPVALPPMAAPEQPRVAELPKAADVTMAPAAGAAAAAPAAAPATAPAAAPAVAPAAPQAPAMSPPTMSPPPGAPPLGLPPPGAPPTVASASAMLQGAAAAAAVLRSPPLQTGMKVKLTGFSSDAMNGLKGTLGKFSEKQGIWQVFLESSTTAKAVRPQNLEIADPTQWKREAVQMAPAAPEPPKDDPYYEKLLPTDTDGDAWVELMRDAYMRQLRSDNEYPEPAPYERVNRFAANQFPVPDGMFPTHALRIQSQMLGRCFNGDGPRPGRRRPGMPPPPRFVAGFIFPQQQRML